MTRTSSRITSLWRHNDAIRNEIRVIAPLMPNQKTAILILCSFVFSPLRINSLFSRLQPPKFWLYMVMWQEIWISLITWNSTPFYPIEMGFSPFILFLCDKNSCTVWTLLLKILVLLLKIGVIYVIILPRKLKNTLTMDKNVKKISSNRPRSIYQYSNMVPRPSGQKLQIFQVSFVCQFPKETWIQRKQHQI